MTQQRTLSPFRCRPCEPHAQHAYTTHAYTLKGTLASDKTPNERAHTHTPGRPRHTNTRSHVDRESSRQGPYGPMDKAPAYGAGDSGFESQYGLFFVPSSTTLFSFIYVVCSRHGCFRFSLQPQANEVRLGSSTGRKETKKKDRPRSNRGEANKSKRTEGVIRESNP
jgi:hypothetical protein